MTKDHDDVRELPASSSLKVCEHLTEGLPKESIRKALRAAIEGRIVELVEGLGLYAFLGEDEDYVLVEELFCSCPDFRVRVLSKRERRNCYHLLALCLSKAMGRVVKQPLADPRLIYDVLVEILTSKRAKGLRAPRS